MRETEVGSGAVVEMGAWRSHKGVLAGETPNVSVGEGARELLLASPKFQTAFQYVLEHSH